MENRLPSASTISTSGDRVFCSDPDCATQVQIGVIRTECVDPNHIRAKEDSSWSSSFVIEQRLGWVRHQCG